MSSEHVKCMRIIRNHVCVHSECVEGAEREFQINRVKIKLEPFSTYFSYFLIKSRYLSNK